MTDFFISYTQADRAWAEWIAWVLEEAGYTTVLQDWDFRPGQNAVLGMDAGLQEADRTIAVLSPAYLRSKFAPPEWAQAFHGDPRGDVGNVVPVVVEPVEIKGLLAPLIHIVLTGRTEKAAEKALLEGVRLGRQKPKKKPKFPNHKPPFPAAGEVPNRDGDTVSERVLPQEIENLPLDVVPERGPLPAGSRMPFAANPLFVGRESDLQALARHLRVGETSAIGEVEIAAASGLGGIGKTQLACEFVHCYGRYFEGGVFWMSFADPAAVPSEVADCGRSLGLDPEWDKLPLAEQTRRVQEVWSRDVPRLLVFDNCEEESLLAAWRPRFGGARVLVTSRRERWNRTLGVESVPLSTLPREKSVELLRRFLPDLREDDLDLAAIAEELGGLPLALHLAGSYLEEYAYAPLGHPAAYLAALHRGSLLDHPSLKRDSADLSPTGHELHVGRTFALSLDKLNPDDETDALARALLARAASFAPGEPIPRSLLYLTVELEQSDAALERAEGALKRLTTLGLLESDKHGAVVIHRLVAAFAQKLAEGDSAEAAVREALLAEAIRLNKTDSPGPLLSWQAHLRAVTDRTQEAEEKVAARLCNELGAHLKMIGDYRGAMPYYERALAIREKAPGPAHPDTAVSLNNLGLLLLASGELSGARLYLERALAVFEETLGRGHPKTASSLNSLGGLTAEQGDLEKARPYFERALAIREKFLGPEHPDTARCINNLGSLLQKQGDLVAALRYYERALSIWEKALGLEHPEVAVCLNNLGSLLQAHPDIVGARPYYERALAICEETLGSEHPSTAATLSNLGSLLQKQGDLAGARPYYERSLAIWEKVQGPEHPNTAIGLNNFGSLLRAQGDLVGARPYFERALAIREKVLGPEHPDTAQSLNNLGALLRAQGDLAGARPYYERALAILEARLGPDHPNARTVSSNLATLEEPPA